MLDPVILELLPLKAPPTVPKPLPYMQELLLVMSAPSQTDQASLVMHKRLKNKNSIAEILENLFFIVTSKCLNILHSRAYPNTLLSR